MIKYDVYKNKGNEMYYCISLSASIYERCLVLPDRPPYTLKRSAWLGVEVITRSKRFHLVARNVVFKKG